MPLWISRRSGTFLFQKLECNSKKPLYCGFSTVLKKRKDRLFYQNSQSYLGAGGGLEPPTSRL